MASDENSAKKAEMQEIKQDGVGGEPTANNSEDSSASVSFDQAIVSDLEQQVHSYGSIKIESFGDYSEWMELFDRFEEIFGNIDDFTHTISESEYVNVKDRFEAMTSELMFYNDKFIRSYNSWTAAKGRSLEERAEKHQVLNFTVFSLFMTLLTFLLSNIVVITKTDFSLKTIVIVNLILLLVTSITFLFIGLFFGLVKMRSKRGYVIKIIILCLMPFLVATTLLLVSFLMP